MSRTFSTLALLAALAGSASAEEVRVSLAGKDAAAVRSDIYRAAAKACTEAYAGSHGEFHEWASCIDGAASDGMAQVKAARQAAAPPASAPATDLAALTPSSSERR